MSIGGEIAGLNIIVWLEAPEPVVARLVRAVHVGDRRFTGQLALVCAPQ